MSFEVQEQGAILAPVLEEGLEVLCICWVIDRSNFAEFWLILSGTFIFAKATIHCPIKLEFHRVSDLVDC